MNLFFDKKVICGKNAKKSKKVIRRMDKVQKSFKDSYNIK